MGTGPPFHLLVSRPSRRCVLRQDSERVVGKQEVGATRQLESRRLSSLYQRADSQQNPLDERISGERTWFADLAWGSRVRGKSTRMPGITCGWRCPGSPPRLGSLGLLQPSAVSDQHSRRRITAAVDGWMGHLLGRGLQTKMIARRILKVLADSEINLRRDDRCVL